MENVDFSTFCENVKIKHPTRGLITLKLYDFQKRYIAALEENRFVVAKKFRQGGFTTVTLAYFLHKIMTCNNQTYMVLSRSDREVRYLSDCVRTMMNSMDISDKFSKNNDHEIRFEETGSKILFLGSKNLGIGCKVDHLFIDEAAFIPDMESAWMSLFSCLSHDGSKCIVLSTTNGKNIVWEGGKIKSCNWFFKLYSEAVRNENSFKALSFSYTEHPEHQIPNLIGKMFENLGEWGFRQEMLCEFLDRNQSQVEKDEDVKVIESGDRYVWLKDLSVAEVEHIRARFNAQKVLPAYEATDLMSLNNEESHNFWKDILDIWRTGPICSREDKKVLERYGYKLPEPKVEEKEENFNPNDLLEIVRANFKELQLSIKNNKLYIGDLPTVINMDKLADLYKSANQVATKEEAADICSSLIKKKLSVLFEFE